MSTTGQAEPRPRTYSSRNLSLRYYEWGDPALPPLILVHGTRDHGRSWDWTARALCDHYRVLVPDLVGHGESEWDAPGGYLLQDYVYDLAELVRHIGAERVRIIGHSLGGRIALSFAGVFPDQVEKLVAIEGVGPTDEIMRERYGGPLGSRLRKWVEDWRAARERQPRPYRSVDEVAERMLERNPRFSGEQVRHLAEHTVKQLADGTYVVRDDPAVRVSRPLDFGVEGRASLAAAVECEVLLLHGTESFLSDPALDGRAGLFPRARAVRVEGAGHWLQHDRFDEFLKLSRDFLA